MLKQQMTAALEEEIAHLTPLLSDIISEPFKPQISSWYHGITISVAINGLVELSIGFDDDNPNWYGYNPCIITKETVTKVEGAILEWMKNVRTGVYARARAAAFVNAIREELLQKQPYGLSFKEKPTSGNPAPLLPVYSPERVSDVPMLLLGL